MKGYKCYVCGNTTQNIAGVCDACIATTAKVMSAMGRIGGMSRSRAKTRAARANGKKGGRPKGTSTKKKEVKS